MENSQTVNYEGKANCNISMEVLEEDKMPAQEKLMAEGSAPGEDASFASSSHLAAANNNAGVPPLPGPRGGNIVRDNSQTVDEKKANCNGSFASSSAVTGEDANVASSNVARTNNKGNSVQLEVNNSSESESDSDGVSAGDEEWFVKLKERYPSDITVKPSIFKVPEWITTMTNRPAYRPLLVSLGPYHHGDPNLEPMECHKHRAVWNVVYTMINHRPRDSSLVNYSDAWKKLASAVDELSGFLEDQYSDLDIDMDLFKEIMLVDGCFLLEIIRLSRLLSSGKKCARYEDDDPVFGTRGFSSLYSALKADVIVMENQLPLVLLEKLQQIISVQDTPIGRMVLNFLGLPYERSKRSNRSVDLDLHFLAVLHRSFCGEQVTEKQDQEWGDWDGTMPSATELAEAGIHFKNCRTGNIHAIDFENGVLSMPEIVVTNRTEKEFLNMMAFERLYGGAGSSATAFMIFMDNIIDSERDVALLRSKGIIKNMLSSDKEAAKMFNTLSKGASLSPSSRLYKVRQEVNDHCTKKWNMWKANFRHKYLSNPWVFSAFVASVLLLMATFLQTIYTVVPYYTKS